jgi:predicted Fe-Mo cluster-binding NifX family protein
MTIAVPVTGGRLSAHFGHCEFFAFFSGEGKDGGPQLLKTEPAPPHAPGLLPRWLAEKGADVIIAGGMGQRARMLFDESGIQVVVGAPVEEPAKLAKQYLDGTLATGVNLCDH